MKSEVSHDIATVLMAISLLTSFIAVFSLIAADEYDPDEDVCVLWDRGASSYSYDDECIQYEGEGQKVAIGVVVVGSVSFSSSLLLFLYSISKKQKEEVDETESTTEAEHKTAKVGLMMLEEIIGLLENNNLNKESEPEQEVEQMIECGECGGSVHDTDLSCPSCGVEFEVEDDSKGEEE